MAKSKEMATNDLSPPDNISKEEILFLGWLTEISIPVSSDLKEERMSFSDDSPVVSEREKMTSSPLSKVFFVFGKMVFSRFTNINSAFPPRPKNRFLFYPPAPS